MSLVIYCEKCDTKQPKDWKPGDLCTECGSAVREEQRCSWCVKLTPKGKFCKHCGNEVQPDQYFGAARILKNLGINQLELTAKLQELPAAKLEQYQRQYNRHYAIVERSLQDIRRLEQVLIVKGQEKFSLAEEALLQRIPFDDNYLQKAEDYCTTTIKDDESFLENREKLLSPIGKQLAEIACLRWLPKRNWTGLHSTSQLIMDNISSKYCSNKVEFALFLGHLNTFDPQFDWSPFQNNQQFLDILLQVLIPILDIPYLKPYAAVALMHSMQQLEETSYQQYNQLEHLANEALDHADQALQLAAALLFQKEEVIAVIARKESAVGGLAVRWLLDHNSAHLLEMVQGNTLTKTQFNVLESCFKEVSNDYWEELAYWKAQKKRVNERQREQRAQLLQEDHEQEEFTQFELKIARENEKLQDEKPKIRAYHSSFAKLSPYVLNQLLDKRSFDEIASAEQEEEPLTNSLLRFVGHFGSYSQQELDTLTENIHYYKQEDNLKHLFSNSPVEGLDYSHAERLYFSKTDAFKDFKKGFEQLAAWTSLMDLGYYPPLPALENALLFLKVHHTTVAFKEDKARDIMLNALDYLLEAPTEISFHTAKYVMTQVLDISNFMLSEWYADMALRRNFCNSGHYFVQDSNKVFKFQADDDFIQHFFEGSYERFMETYNRVIALKSQSTFMENWISRKPDALASFLEQNPEIAIESLKNHKTAIIYSHQGILNIKSEEGHYPMIKALGLKKWDMGDVILYYHRTGDLFYNQPETCLQRLTEWMTADGGKNFYSPNFEKYVQHFFTFSAKTEQMPFGMLELWLHEAAASTLSRKKKKFYDDRFSSLVPNLYSRPLVTVQLHGETFPLNSDYIIENTFQGFGNFLNYIDINFTYGLTPLTNRFCLHVLFHAKERLIEYCQTDQEQLRTLLYALIALARHPDNEKNHKEDWLEGLVDTLFALEAGLENKVELINNVWSLGGLHFSITNKVYGYVKVAMTKYIKQSGSEGVRLVYNFFEDYFYSNGSDVRWVKEVLDSTVKEIAAAIQSNEALWFDIGNLVLRFLSKEQLIPTGESEPKRILDKLSAHFISVLSEIPEEDFPQKFINTLFDHLTSKQISGVTAIKWKSFLEKRGFEPALVKVSGNTEMDNTQEVEANESKLEVPDEIHYDQEKMYMNLSQISMMMGSFKVEQEQMNILINHLPYYKKDKADNPMLHSILMMKQADIIEFLKDDASIAIQLYQALFEILIDPLCAPDRTFPILWTNEYYGFTNSFGRLHLCTAIYQFN
ncbi:zinc ribbon domain-containing protein [Marivirga tractuosa]|uniref:zinc ribbon domain-containing protein n=1 Tax=Marivirga tractuosa TaxID=1006 RepID=UPI0035D0B577